MRAIQGFNNDHLLNPDLNTNQISVEHLEHDIDVHLSSIYDTLKESQFEFEIFRQVLPVIKDYVSRLSHSQRYQWQNVIQKYWLNRELEKESSSFLLDFGELAIFLKHWGIAKDVFYQFLITHKMYGDVFSNLALAELETGNIEQALDCITYALKINETDEFYKAFQSKIIEIEQFNKNISWYFPNNNLEALTLLPLQPLHAESFFEQYNNTNIPELTQLPKLNTLEQVKGWIMLQLNRNHVACFSVIHQVWGFIGVVSYRWVENIGFFYFWIGRDYQSLGFGQAAAKLLLIQTQKNRIQKLYTANYQFNKKSQSALLKSGFTPVDYDVHSNDYYYYSYPKVTNSLEIKADLEKLLLLEDKNASAKAFHRPLNTL